MKPFLAKLLNRGTDLCNTEPLLAFFLAGALLAVFVSGLPQRPVMVAISSFSGLLLLVYEHLKRLLWVLALTVVLAGALGLLRTYLHQTVNRFQHDHGRITEANYHAVQTIWGAEQVQGELRVDLFYDEETTERIESEDLTKPAILRKKRCAILFVITRLSWLGMKSSFVRVRVRRVRPFTEATKPPADSHGGSKIIPPAK